MPKLNIDGAAQPTESPLATTVEQLAGTLSVTTDPVLIVGYCECGCGGLAPIAKETSRRNKWVKGQPKRFIHGHAVRTRNQPLVSPAHYEIDELTLCWNWLMATDNHGYGVKWNGMRVEKAHRVYYTYFKGPIPEGLQIDHLCRNRLCVNPHHLEPVTCKENLYRGHTITAANAAKTHCPRGHEYNEENTYHRSYGARECRTCHALLRSERYRRRQNA